MSAPEGKVAQNSCFRASCALLSSRSLPPLLLLSTGNPPRLAANRKPRCPSVLGRAKPYQLWKQCLLLGFFILICSAQAGGRGANGQITWGPSAEWLGQGRRVHTQCQESPGHGTGSAGWAIAYTRLWNPGMFSEKLPQNRGGTTNCHSIFLKKIKNNLL